MFFAVLDDGALSFANFAYSFAVIFMLFGTSPQFKRIWIYFFGFCILYSSRRARFYKIFKKQKEKPGAFAPGDFFQVRINLSRLKVST